MNPLIPSVLDVAGAGIAVLRLMLAVWAVVSLARTASRMSPRRALAWVLIVLAVPLVGPLAWLGAGRRADIPET